jgi:hypothetical protein
MKKILLLVSLIALALPAFASVSAVPTAHSPARHGSLTPHKKALHKKRRMSEAQQTTASRMKACGKQWKTDKLAGRVGGPNQQKWPQYWSACNKRLKG